MINLTITTFTSKCYSQPFPDIYTNISSSYFIENKNNTNVVLFIEFSNKTFPLSFKNTSSIRQKFKSFNICNTTNRQSLSHQGYEYLHFTVSFPLVVAVPATLAAEHWNQAESNGSTVSMVSVDLPPSVSILANIRFSYYVFFYNVLDKITVNG